MSLMSYDGFAERPFLVFWEITRACALACRHCRAEAQSHRHPDELSREESSRLIRQLAELIAQEVGFTGRLEFDPSMPDGTPRKLMDVSRLAAAGWPIVEGPVLRTGATRRIRSVYVRDPDLNLIEISEQLAKPPA